MMHAEYDALLTALVEACRAHYGKRLVSVAVYGSVGRGTARDGADINMLIVAEDLPDDPMWCVRDFMAVQTALEPRFQAARAAGLYTELSPIFRTPADLARKTPLPLEMTEDARILVDRDARLADTIERLRGRLRELGSRRIWLGNNAWYWDLKPDYKWGDTIDI